MARVNLGKTIVPYPMPVSLVGAKVEGRVNFLAVAWLTMVGYNPPQIAVVLNKNHYTNAGIKQNRAFSVCFPSREMLQKTDYCGIKSGKTVDKSQLFGVFYGESLEAPLIEECPLNVECRLEKVIDNVTHEIFIGEIMGVYAQDSVLSEGKIDLKKSDPILLAQSAQAYYALGEKIGEAWKAGKE